MEYRINENELAVLTFLHENAKGFDARPWFCFKPEDIEVATELTTEQLMAAASYLEGWGLTRANDTLQVRGMPLGRLHLTHLGEAYMRDIEAKLEGEKLLAKGQRLGIVLLKKIGQAAIAAATAALTGMITSRHRS